MDKGVPVISLFSRSEKNAASIESNEESSARIQAAIERALRMPEPDMSDLPEGMQFSTQGAANKKSEVAMDPWDALKEFVVHDQLGENAA